MEYLLSVLKTGTLSRCRGVNILRPCVAHSEAESSARAFGGGHHVADVPWSPTGIAISGNTAYILEYAEPFAVRVRTVSMK
jgi:hypothetical protein